MAQRKVFSVGTEECPVRTHIFTFPWEPGMSTSQRRKSAQNLQKEFHKYCDQELMEISSAGEVGSLGYKLSAFNLLTKTILSDEITTVEKVYQGSKIVLINGEEVILNDLFYCKDSLTAKKDERLKNPIVGFKLCKLEYRGKPRVFYNWLYINSLVRFNKELFDQLVASRCLNFCDTQAKLTVDACQAEACALLMYMGIHGLDYTSLYEIEKVMRVYMNDNEQLSL